MKAIIFSGGNFTSLPEQIALNEYSLKISADSGYLIARDLGVVPDIFIGDFDSVLEEEVVAKKIIRLNPVKDKTDTQEAIDVAILNGATHITILGALGNRIDHTLANIHLLKYAKDKNVNAEIVDVDTCITLVSDERYVNKQDGFCLSLIPLTDCTGVCVSGVYYPLDNAEMRVGDPYGISNEFTEDIARISILSGELLLMLCKS